MPKTLQLELKLKLSYNIVVKYAVIRLNGNQYKVEVGQEFLVDKLTGDPRPEVLLVNSDGTIKVGKPVLDKAKVVLSVVKDQVLGEKIHVRTFKAKARIRRHIGSRAKQTLLKVKSIS